jgi:hypothetical protein
MGGSSGTDKIASGARRSAHRAASCEHPFRDLSAASAVAVRSLEPAHDDQLRFHIAQTRELGLVDELRMFRNPVVVGGGTPFLPPVTEDVRLARDLRALRARPR